MHKQWKGIINADAYIYSKNVSMNRPNADLRKWKISYFFQSFGEAYISSLSIHLKFDTWIEVEIWTSNTPC